MGKDSLCVTSSPAEGVTQDSEGGDTRAATFTLRKTEAAASPAPFSAAGNGGGTSVDGLGRTSSIGDSLATLGGCPRGLHTRGRPRCPERRRQMRVARDGALQGLLIFDSSRISLEVFGKSGSSSQNEGT